VIATSETSAAQAPAAGRRGRPGRRTTEDRTHAVLALLSGKATVDQLAARYGVLPATVEGWRQLAMEGIEEVLRQGTSRSPHEVELERDLTSLRKAFTDLAIKHELVERALQQRPSRPARSPR
jgi:transposase-like protein